MTRFGIGCLGALALVASVASAQEQSGSAGAGTVEVSATPLGGVFFMPSESTNEPEFKNYGLGGAIAGNFNRWFGLEGDLAYAVGRRQDLIFPQTVLIDQKTPSMLNYTGSLVFNPWGKDRRVVPYVAGGMGGLTVFNATSTQDLAIVTNQHFLTTNLGGGVRWFMGNGWGLRGDYRAVMLKGRDDAPSFFGREDRLAHRISGSVVVTY
jgi:hypothetical protein